ncbi:TetR family transcriptional regulator [Longibacter salinarum]|uniref:TetR family transcriptional regulator n=1 Tax=Longibacter salinarum TaxID=1850348 RepID=A0A2A8CUW4_9BACT|nr:TetR/AcrR family transcriptional regulator [Longibacter salinarum]PEN12339.1 TetR family transcriptional regulator [Longibacter salinarum]
MATTKRDAIIEAALALFAEKGVDATSTREITERADTAEGTLYRHFDGKDDLVRSLFEENTSLFHDVLARSAKTETEPREQLKAMVRGIFDFAEQYPAAFAYLLSVHEGVLNRVDTSHEPLPMQLFTRTLRAGTTSGVFRDVPPVLATGWIVGLAQRAIVLQRSDLLSASREDVTAQTVDATLRLVETTR